MSVELTLPHPPSVNTYWRIGHHGRLHVSNAGVKYRGQVWAAVTAARITPFSADVRLALVATVSPPDRRRRDLDNCLKALQDSLEFAGVFADDSQIDRLDITRGPAVPGGRVDVVVRLHPPTEQADADEPGDDGESDAGQHEQASEPG